MPEHVAHAQRRADREQAFVYWYNGGDRRSAREVAAEFGVIQRTVEQWVADEDWVARAERLDLLARQELEAKITKGVARRLQLQVGAGEQALAQFIRNVQAGNIVVTSEQALAWAKHLSVLDGGVSDRTAEVDAQEDAEYRIAAQIALEMLGTDPDQLKQDEEDGR